MKEIPVLYSEKEECCGCGACCAVCPQSAVTMTEDEEGFEYPLIDESTCIGCCLCHDVIHFLETNGCK